MLTISGNCHLPNSNSWCSYQSKHPTIYSCKKNCKWWYMHTWFLFAWFLLRPCLDACSTPIHSNTCGLRWIYAHPNKALSASFDLHNNLCTFHQIYLGRIRYCVFIGFSSWIESYSYIIGPSYLKPYWLDLPCRPNKETSKSWIHSFCWGQNTLKLGTQFYLPGIETE